MKNTSDRLDWSAITDAEGAHRLRIVFDDGHSTGLYSWQLLLQLGREQDEIWQAYLDKLDAEGLSRD